MADSGVGMTVDQRDGPLSTAEFFTMILLLGVPVLNLVLLVIWSFGSGTNLNRRNLSRAMLILTVILAVVWVISFALGLTLIGSNPEMERLLEDFLAGI